MLRLNTGFLAPGLVLAGLAGAGLAVTATAKAPAPQPGFTPAPKAAPARPCVSREEARALTAFVLPAVVDGLGAKCRGTLARTAYLRSEKAETLSDRLRRDGGASWPVAKRAIEKLTGSRLPTPLGERVTMSFAEGAAADMILRQFEPADCADADRIVSGLAPLPSANFSDVFATILILAAREDPKNQLKICPLPAPAATR